MKKTIYFMRHSEVLKGIDHEFNNDSIQLTNEKSVLSVNGERLAEEKSKLDEFNFSILSSSFSLVIQNNFTPFL